jgi:hypothetical protein
VKEILATAISSHPYGGTGINVWYAKHHQEKFKAHLSDLK